MQYNIASEHLSLYVLISELSKINTEFADTCHTLKLSYISGTSLDEMMTHKMIVNSINSAVLEEDNEDLVLKSIASFISNIRLGTNLYFLNYSFKYDV